MSLRDLLLRVPDEYPAYRAGRLVDGTSPTFKLVTRELPAALEELASGRRPYAFRGSTGVTNITPSPWVAILDRGVTDTPQRGYYVVYLFSTDLRRVYLCLALGVTHFEETLGNNRKMRDRLSATASALASRLNLNPPFSSGPIDLAADDPGSKHGQYELSVIASAAYQSAALPDEATLRADLLTVLDHYDELRKEVGPDVDEEAAVEEVEVSETGLMEEVPFEPTKQEKRGSKGGSSRRSRASKKVGDAGEKRVYEHERQRLLVMGRADLAERVRWLADEGEQPGYDVLSFNEDGSQRWIEVKTSKGDKVSRVDLTEGERQTAEIAPEGRYWLYIVTRVFRGAQVMIIRDPAKTLSWGPDNPRPVSWSLRLG